MRSRRARNIAQQLQRDFVPRGEDIVPGVSADIIQQDDIRKQQLYDQLITKYKQNLPDVPNKSASVISRTFRKNLQRIRKQRAEDLKRRYAMYQPAVMERPQPKIKTPIEKLEDKQKTLKKITEDQIVKFVKERRGSTLVSNTSLGIKLKNQVADIIRRQQEEELRLEEERKLLEEQQRIAAITTTNKTNAAAEVITKLLNRNMMRKKLTKLIYKQQSKEVGKQLEVENEPSADIINRVSKIKKENDAIILLQNAYRNRLARKEFAAVEDLKIQQQNQEILQGIEAAKSTLSRTFSSKLARDQYIVLRNEAIRKQQQEEARKAREAAQEAKEIEELKKEQRNYNSILIQNAYRNRLARKQFEEVKEVKEQKDQQKLQAIEAAKATLARAISTRTTRDKYITLLKEAQELAKKEDAVKKTEALKYSSSMVDNLTTNAIDNFVKRQREQFLDDFIANYNKKKKRSIFSSIYSFISRTPTLEDKEKEYERILEEIRKEEERKKEEQEQIKKEVLEKIKEEDRERQRELKRQRQIENERKKREKEEKEEQERIRKEFEKPRMEVIPEVSREDITPDPDDDIPYTIKQIKKMSYEDIKKLRRKYIDEYSYEGREEELTPKRRLIYQLYKKGQVVEQPAARGPRIKDQYTNEELDNMSDEEFDVLFKAAFPDVIEIRKDTPRGYRDIYNASKRRATKLKITIEKLKIDKEVDKEFKAESKRIKENNDKFTIYTIFRDQAEKDFYVNFIKEELEISTKNYEEALAEANTLKERNEASTNFYADRYKKQKDAESLAKQNKTMVKFYDKILKEYKKIKV